MPRYVILEHDQPTRHWDLMLEAGGVLRTWRLAAPPGPGRAVRAEASFDHRPHYLDYEGPVSGNRGHVTRWDGGTYAWEEDHGDRLAVQLDGGQLCGTLRLEREGGGWAASFVPRGPAAAEG